MALTDTHDFAAAPPLGGDVADFVTLLKPRVMVLVVFTALAGIVGAPGGLHPALAFISLIAIAAGGGASGALNMWYEADSDARMRRTAGRPVPAGRLQPADALGFGLVLAGFSIGLLGLAANWLAAGLLAFTIAFYAVLYTMVLKRLTAQNIVIGGAAGALPPVVGWAAVTGSVPLEPLILFLMIFLWTPPHFWALALFTQGDYERAGIPMMPNVAGEPSTRRQILAYALVLGPAGLLPWAFGQAGPVYAVAAALLGAEFVRRAFVLVRDGDADGNRAAKRLFGYSILYLFGVFGAYMADIVAQRLAG